MSETIARRVARVVSGGVNALIDAVENAAPEAVMAQAIREVEQIIGEVRAELGRIEAARHLAMSELNRLNTENERLAQQVEVALAEDREDLVRAGLGKQLDIEDRIPVLQKSLAEQGDSARELEAYIAALLAKKREMEETLQSYAKLRGAAAGPGAPAAGHVRLQDRVAGAGAAFDRVMARQTGVPGAVPGGVGDLRRLQELQDLQYAHRIEERLARLRLARRGDACN
jgi:phage shock protein A